ncbi:hypothetical protein AgCh_025811 [Apium graveolens]
MIRLCQFCKIVQEEEDGAKAAADNGVRSPITKAQGPTARAQEALSFNLEGPRTRGNITTVQLQPRDQRLIIEKAAHKYAETSTKPWGNMTPKQIQAAMDLWKEKNKAPETRPED